MPYSRKVHGRLQTARHGLSVVAALLILLGIFGPLREPNAAQAQEPSILDARQRGTFTLGAAQADVSHSSDPVTQGRRLRLDYRLPQGSAAGVWAKALPDGLASGTVDLVRLLVDIPNSGQLSQIAIAAELKGTSGVQRIPLRLQPGRNCLEAMVDWGAIGPLVEIVFAVSRTGSGELAAGTLHFDVGFDRLPMLRKLGMWPAARMAAVLLASLLMAALAALVWLVVGRWPAGASARHRGVTPRAEPGLKDDFVGGSAFVFIAGLSITVAWLGGLSSLEAGWIALGVAVAGAVLAEWLKFGLTGKHLTPAELFQDMLASGLLAASASSLAILQTPSTWSEVVLLSRGAAVATTLLYHGANLYRLASSGKHLSTVAGAMIVATPYVAGSLLLLGSDRLAHAMGYAVSAGLCANSPAVLETLGRLLVVLAFNEAVANGLSLATGRGLLTSLTAHVSLLAVAAAVVVAPWIADLGSSAAVAEWPGLLRLAVTLLTTVLSQAGLWAEVYLITGMIMDALRGKAPAQASALGHPGLGIRKGVVYSGTFMGILYGLDLLWRSPLVRDFVGSYPLLAAALFGGAAFPLAKTLIESFDGSQGFFRRVAQSYRNPVLYARGAVVGMGFAYGLGRAMAQQEMAVRVWFGFGVGVTASAGVNVLRDLLYAWRGRGRFQAVRVYLLDLLLCGFIGAAIGFYLDTAQVAIVVDKFHRYVSAGAAPQAYTVYPLLSKWGFIDLGNVTGGVKLLLAESLAGVISWSIPAWLFAINRTLLAAYFRRETAPIRALFTRDGLVEVTQNMILVLRWGLWMSPIINSFLRPMGEPTWYNQDGAIRTLIAIFQEATLSREAFQSWSLQIFVYLLAYDLVRILIWVDHMGLRVATLVNLSFLGMDRLESRLARFLAPASTARCIPEAVKRFTTWAPLLIPFYIPRGQDWDYAWSHAEALQQAGQGVGLLAALSAIPWAGQLLLVFGAVAGSTAMFSAVRRLRARRRSRSTAVLSLANAVYEVLVKANGETLSRVPERDYDVSRRSYDFLDPAGRALFLVDTAAPPGDAARAWPLVGNFPGEEFTPSRMEHDGSSLKVSNTSNGLKTTVEITLPGRDDPAELWTITVENLTDADRVVKLAPYLEWVLNRPDADRGHTQYNRLFPEMEYVSALHAVLAWDKHSKAMGILAADAAPEGFLTSRIDFIGRARSVWTPRVLETLAFCDAQDADAHPTFDPIGSLLLGSTLKPGAAWQTRLLIGLAKDKSQAIDLIARHLGLPRARDVAPSRTRAASHRIAHGEIPPGTPRPYSQFIENGRSLMVRTPFTPRPYDHTMSNALGHVVVVTNRGLHTTSNGNSQQNRLTPDWPDIVTRELPGEAFYLYDPDEGQWYSPTYHPLNDATAAHEVRFGVDGTATYRMTQGTLATELTVFVPPDEPTGVYLLTVKNRADVARRIRLAPYFQMVLASQPEHSGPLKVRHASSLNALFFENPRNGFRTGPAFVALSCPAERVETSRGRFFGAGRSAAHPWMVEQGAPDPEPAGDDRPIAAFLATLEIPAHGTTTVAVVLGQADTHGRAEQLVRKYRDPHAARSSLENTRRWWSHLMDTVQIQTNHPPLDHYLDWLKYQALAERIWARRGFYQASGAFGFRDQLQDAVNLMWLDPSLARRQILLHAAQQFIEGDVVHWFHRLQDGRTGFVARTHASDNLLWLPWAVMEYVGATGDDTILDEQAPYLEAEQPFEPLPKGKHGMGFDPLRSSRADSVYQHCLKAIDLVLEHRMGSHGLPRIGTGDWNDGLDEIGSQGRGESVWLGFFLYYILDRMAGIIDRREGPARKDHYVRRALDLKAALERTWRDDRYLRAIHDDGTEIGICGSGVWEIDALTAAWAVMSGVNRQRGRIVFDTALRVLERENTILLGWPALREDTQPYLGRSSWYPEGVRENGMYCHGVQWLVGAARILARQAAQHGDSASAEAYREAAYRLWLKISPIPHVAPDEIETYGGQPNKQAADIVTTFDPGRMIWHGYTGAAGWMLRQALEAVVGARLVDGELLCPDLHVPIGDLRVIRLERQLDGSPLNHLVASSAAKDRRGMGSPWKGPARPKCPAQETLSR